MNLLKRRRRLLIFLTAAIALGVAGGILVPRLFGADSERAQPPLFMVYIPDIGGILEGVGFINTWNAPSAVVVVGTQTVVLDTGNNRVIVLNEAEEVVASIGEMGEQGIRLDQPEAMAVLGGSLYVANTNAGEVIIMDLSGSVDRTIKLPAGADGQEPRPAGIAVLPDGSFYVSDSANNAVLRYGIDGSLIERIDADMGEPYSFNEPRGLTVDRFGSLYVADSLNGRVRKYAPNRKPQAEFMMKGTPAFSWPVSVAVGPDGTVYFSDNKRHLVQAFSQANTYLGIVGLYDAGRVDTPSVLDDPYGLWMIGDRLYVADREEGIFGFDIDPAYWAVITDAERIDFTHGE